MLGRNHRNSEGSFPILGLLCNVTVKAAVQADIQPIRPPLGPGHKSMYVCQADK